MALSPFPRGTSVLLFVCSFRFSFLLSFFSLSTLYLLFPRPLPLIRTLLLLPTLLPALLVRNYLWRRIRTLSSVVYVILRMSLPMLIVSLIKQIGLLTIVPIHLIKYYYGSWHLSPPSTEQVTLPPYASSQGVGVLVLSENSVSGDFESIPLMMAIPIVKPSDTSTIPGIDTRTKLIGLTRRGLVQARVKGISWRIIQLKNGNSILPLFCSLSHCRRCS